MSFCTCAEEVYGYILIPEREQSECPSLGPRGDILVPTLIMKVVDYAYQFELPVQG